MMKKIDPKSKILIYGYGVEGKSTERFFNSRVNPAALVIYDENIEKYNTKPDFQDFDLISVSAGINRQHKVPADALDRCTSNTELFFDHLTPKNKKKIIGITGTKGKSSTTKLIHETLAEAGLKSQIAGNFGTGLLDLLSIIDDLDFLVVELSSYQLAHLQTSPHFALCTNLYEDHLDWHGSRQYYHQCKANLWRHQRKGDLFLVPQHQADHPLFQHTNAITCLPAPANLFDKKSIWQADHYLENFGLAETLMEYLDRRKDPGQAGMTVHCSLFTAFKTTCKTLQPLPHRLDHVGTFQGIDFYDDAISTNVASTLAAVTFFGKKCGSLLLGGQDRDQDFLYLIEALEVINPYLHIIVLPSQSRDRLEQILTEEFQLPFSLPASMKEAVSEAFEVTPKGQICLLSPAAPSFDHYKNYMAKGEDFKACVEKRAHKLTS